MVTLPFLIIAYVIRQRFLPEGTSRADRVLYYTLSVFMTPLLGPWFFKVLIESKSADPDESSSMIWPYVG